MLIKCTNVSYRAFAWDGLEGSFAAFGFELWHVWAANVPDSEGMSGKDYPISEHFYFYLSFVYQFLIFYNRFLGVSGSLLLLSGKLLPSSGRFLLLSGSLLGVSERCLSSSEYVFSMSERLLSLNECFLSVLKAILSLINRGMFVIKEFLSLINCSFLSIIFDLMMICKTLSMLNLR